MSTAGNCGARIGEIETEGDDAGSQTEERSRAIRRRLNTISRTLAAPDCEVDHVRHQLWGLVGEALTAEVAGNSPATPHMTPTTSSPAATACARADAGACSLVSAGPADVPGDAGLWPTSAPGASVLKEGAGTPGGDSPIDAVNGAGSCSSELGDPTTVASVREALGWSTWLDGFRNLNGHKAGPSCVPALSGRGPGFEYGRLF